MTSSSAMMEHSAPPLPRDVRNPSVVELGLVAVGVLFMCVPTYITLDKTIWNIVGQGHGPVMLALALWLAWQRLPIVTQLENERRILGGGVVLGIALLSYILGRSQDMLFMEVGAQIFLFAGLLIFYKGYTALKRMWFPLFFLLFLVPLPAPVVDAVTAPLKASVSYVAEAIIYQLGYPIGRAGVTLSIGPYQLLVADACAGLNSIFALEAIGVFYMSIVNHKSQLRNVLLASLIIPISFVSNVVRVITLVLVTYYFGDEVGQGFVHNFAGILLFMFATLLTIATDAVLGLFFKNSK